MRSFLASLLVLVIATSFIAVGASVGLKDPSIGPGIRKNMSQYPLLRSLYSLHDTGDAANDYLGRGTDGVDIIVKPYTAQWFGDSALTDLAASITAVTGKRTGLTSESDAAKTPSHAKLYIYLETENDEDPTTLGKTFNEYGIILYKAALEKFTYYTPDTRNTYVSSTLLHEFGHQIGLAHYEKDGCLMSSSAEKNHVAQLKPSEVVTGFCADELEQIEKIKNSL